MAARTDIDPEATSAGLAAAAESRAGAVAGSAVSLPRGVYVGATNVLAEDLIAERLSALSTRVVYGAGAASASVTSYQATEEANAKALET
jgi:hypothetical protein